MKGAFDRIYNRVKAAHEEAAGKGILMKALLGKGPSKKDIIRDLVEPVPHRFFGKEYFEAMTIVLQSHWFVSYCLDLEIGDFLMPEPNVPQRAALIRDVLFHVPWPAKVSFIEKHDRLPKKQIDNLSRINAVRNGFAHFYPKKDKRMVYRNISIITEDGLERFWKDCEDVIGAIMSTISEEQPANQLA